MSFLACAFILFVSLMLETLEEKLWKSIQFVPPLYGADMSGSLMDPEVTYALDI
jgi:hypothetical protein